MNSTKVSVFISMLLAVALLATGCKSISNTTKGVVIGTGGGAAVGAVIGKTLGNTAAGAIGGAVVGGTAGAIIGGNMDKKARELEEEMDGVTVQRVEEGIAVSFDSGILFDFDSSTLRREGNDNLRKLTTIVKRDEDTILMIVGHTDSRGDENYNLQLSERRAQSAKTFLVSQRLSSSRIEIVGRGEYEPIAENETDAGRQENRRIEVAIYASPEYVEQVKSNN
ncbi:OmpA family protein [Rhodohalobacter sp. 8-1]|uniref:OmpA family protein n=1 Tax=Rhodohalobacter sp. 8-1 TaxID=3131972 RepID=UPI0030EBCC26